MNITLQLQSKNAFKIDRVCAGFVLLCADAHLLMDQTRRMITDSRYDEGDFYWLPKSRSEISANGIVWLAKTNQEFDCPAGTIPLRLVSETLWIPCTCELQPELDDGLLKKSLSGAGVIKVWLPATGLIGFEPADRIVRVSFFIPPAEPASDLPWKQPPEVWIPPTRLVELSRLNPPTATDFLNDMRQEIGKPKDTLFQSNDQGTGAENQGPVSKLKTWLLGKMDDMAGSPDQTQDSDGLAAGNRPKPPAATGWGAIGGGIGKAMGLVAAPLAFAMSKMMQNERERQIEKLMDMMRSNPDEALKYAIPIGSDSLSGRGMAIPGATLFARLTDFSMGELRDSGPVDQWNIGDDLQARLHQKYHEQANREIAAGRYRRAAYIYAHLLTDFRLAASTLERGKFYAEAAALYQEKLRDRSDAARCYALANMHQEAVDLYISLNELEKAGVVWLDADQPEKARELFVRAYQQLLNRDSVIAAAKILEGRLDARSNAIDLLQKQWPLGKQVLESANLAIMWLGEDGHHDDTLDFLKVIADTVDPRHFVDAAHIMSDTSKSYPDHAVRISAEDFCRLAASRALSDRAPIERTSVLQLLSNLDAHDEQLRRDSKSFELTKPTNPPPITSQSSTTELDTIQLSRSLTFVDYAVDKNRIVGLGVNGQYMRIVFQGMHQPSDFQQSRRVGLDRQQDVTDRRDAFLVTQGSRSFPNTAFAPVPTEQELIGGTVIRKLSGQLACTMTYEGSMVCVRQNNDRLVLTFIGSVNASYDLSEPLLVAKANEEANPDHEWEQNSNTKGWFRPASDIASSIDTRAMIAMVDQQCLIMLGNHLFSLDGQQVIHIHQLGAAGNDICASPRHTVARVAVAHSKGLEVLRIDEQSAIQVCDQHHYELVTWIPSGKIAAIANDELHCFEVRGSSFKRSSVTRLTVGKSPVKLLLLEPNIVGVAFSDGLVRRFRIH